MLRPRLLILQPTAYCNLDCSYCYLRRRDDKRLMPPDVVEAVRSRILAKLAGDACPSIVCHAGEPTTAPIAWYENAYERFAGVVPAGAGFAMQTNGVAIDDKWVALLRRYRTNVSVSIDGPKRFHDARRRTRAGGPTWALGTRGLRRLQEAGFDPPVITVLHPGGLECADEYFDFYREHAITEVGFSIDEMEGGNRTSSFAGSTKTPIVAFLMKLMTRALETGYPLFVKEIERIARVLVYGGETVNEQVEPWAAIIVAADGTVSTFSPELMESRAPAYRDFRFGNILADEIETMATGETFQKVAHEVAVGIESCRNTCGYFAVCGGGSPVNKFAELGSLRGTETQFCRMSTQSSADALVEFLRRRTTQPSASLEGTTEGTHIQR
jgi:uncharacterized protein